MNENLQFIFKTIAAVVSKGKLPELPKGIDWNLVYTICIKHNIANMFAYALSDAEFSNIPENIKMAFLKQLQLDVMLDARQNSEMKLISDKFDELNLDYMPMKGIIIKNIYPTSDMRRMSDIDILTRIGMEEEYKKVMLDLGYEFIRNKTNEYVFKKSVISIELHRYLITPGNDDLFSYYDTGWKFAKKIGACRHQMSAEDEFIYLITHFVKHYRNAGCGIKPLIDIWVYKNNSELDMEYINEQLQKMNLSEFAENLFRLIKVWFEGEAADETMLEMTKFIVLSGEYGTSENSSAAKSLRDKHDKGGKEEGRIKLWLKIIFLNKKGMASKYPILNKLPFLLPFLWVYRVFDVVLFKRGRIKHQNQNVNNRFGENVSRYDEHMKMVGLDINNGRK